MGRANRLLARRARSSRQDLPTPRESRPVSPARSSKPEIRSAPPFWKRRGCPIARRGEGGRFNLLVMGGSQGARVMSDVVPPAIELLPPELRARLTSSSRRGERTSSGCGRQYARLGVAFEAEPFFKDLPRAHGRAHLVVSRSGASTVAELAVIGRPSILVPLPGALDQDQAANAKTLGDLGAAIVLPQVGVYPRAGRCRASQGALQTPDRLDQGRARCT